MIFAHTITNVLNGTKTMTRRIVKDGQRLNDGCVYTTKVYGYYAIDPMGQRAYFNGHTDRTVYKVGQTLAVQRGRGKKSEGRIRITDIRLDDAREIVDADVKAEGFDTTADFLMVWCQMHDPKFFFERDEFEPDKFIGVTPDGNPWLWTEGELMAQLWLRPAGNYACWAISFVLDAAVTP